MDSFGQLDYSHRKGAKVSNAINYLALRRCGEKQLTERQHGRTK